MMPYIESRSKRTDEHTLVWWTTNAALNMCGLGSKPNMRSSVAEIGKGSLAQTTV